MKKMHTFCYHITNGITRAALICGTVRASSMEEAGEIAAGRARLTRVRVGEDDQAVWVNDDRERRLLYVAFDAALPVPTV